MISGIEVNHYGIASVWLKEPGLLIFAPSVRFGASCVVRYEPVLRKLRSKGLLWPESIHNN